MNALQCFIVEFPGSYAVQFERIVDYELQLQRTENYSKWKAHHNDVSIPLKVQDEVKFTS